MENERSKRKYWVRAAFLALSAALTALTLAAHAQSTAPVVYPAKGQTPMQQDRDRYECHDWARSQSGFDPSQPQPSSRSGPPLPPPIAHMKEQQQAQAKQKARSGYDRGFAACMEARGYVVR
jgi:hypothetical protein